MIARVAPEDKVRLVRLLQQSGEIVAMTGDGVNDAPALKAANIGVAMGITGTEVSKEAAVMILTDDNFATIVGAVEYGRALYDNLLKYLRFQMSTLVAYIAIFIGAGIFAIAGGIPLDPLQILWLNMVIDIPIAVALGFDEPTGGLMERSPRPVGAPVLSTANWVRLCTQGFVMTVGTLIAYQIGEANYDLAVASTMLLTTLSLFHLAAGLLARDQVRTIFSRAAIPGPTQLRRYGVALLAIILVTEIGFLQRVFSVVDLTLAQWGICTGIALSLVVVEEVIKFFIRRRARSAAPADARRSRSPREVNRWRSTFGTGASSRSSTSLPTSSGSWRGRSERGRGARSRRGGSMSRRERILKKLVVEPGTPGGARRTRPGMDRWEGVRAALRGQTEGCGEGHPEARGEGALRRAGAPVGERLLRAPDRLPGVGCGRQGLDDRARDVRREPAGRPGRLVPAAVERGARPRLPLAHQPGRCPSAAGSGSSTARTTRRSSRCGSIPNGSRRSASRPGRRGKAFWKGRFDDINGFERHLDRNGTKVVKFFLHVSKDEQKRRFMARLDTPGKEWKFKASDVAERSHWDEYMQAFEDAITATSTAWAPWYVIPADHKPVMQAIVARDPRRHDPGARAVLARGVGQGPNRERRGAQAARGRGP